MGYADTKAVIIYRNTDQPYYIYMSHHAWFDEYNYNFYIEDKHTPVYLFLKQYPESLLPFKWFCTRLNPYKRSSTLVK